MDDYSVNFDWVMLAQVIAEQNDGEGIEFVNLMAIVTDYNELITEYSDKSIECFKRMMENGEMSKGLFELLANKEISEAEYENTSEGIKEEYKEFCKKSMRGEVDRKELQATYQKAIKLRRRLLKAITDDVQAIINDYELPQSLQYGICMIVEQMKEQLDTMVLQAMT